MAVVILHRLSICLYLYALVSRDFFRVLCALVISSGGRQSSSMGHVDTVGSGTLFERPTSAIGIRWRRARSMDPIRGLCSACHSSHVDLERHRQAAEKLRRAPHVAPSHPTVCPWDRDGHLWRIQGLSSPNASAAPCQAGTAVW